MPTTPSIPAAPVLGTSFTALVTNNPAAAVPGVNLDAEFNRTNTAVAQLIGAVSVSVNADGTLKSSAVMAAYNAAENSQDAGGTNINDAPSAASAVLAQAWAEYMPGVIPPSILDGTGITGDHNSSRWWASQAAAAVSGVLASAASAHADANSANTAAIASQYYAGLLVANYGNSTAYALPASPGQLFGGTSIAGTTISLTPSANLRITGNNTLDLAATIEANVVGNLTGNASGTAANITGTNAIANGGTGSITAAAALTALGGLAATLATTTYAPIANAALTGAPTAPTATLGTTTTQLATTAFVGNATAVVSGSANVGRNFLLNTQFNVQQRGQGPWTSTGYTADRWFVAGNHSTGSMSVSMVSLTDADRTAIGDECATAGLQYVVTGGTGASDDDLVLQNMETARKLSAKTVTISFWAKANVAGLKLGVSVAQVFGTGGSPSAQGNTTTPAVTLTTAFVRYTATVALPSTAGKTFGTNGGTDYTSLVFWLSAGATPASTAGIGVQSGTFTIWGPQLEIGVVATPLEKRDNTADFATCQRFYQTVVILLAVSNQSAGLSYAASANMPVLMRANPTVSPLSTTNTNFTLTVYVAGLNYVYVNGTATSSGTVVVNVTLGLSADI